MTNLYICYTKYQFLIALLKIKENEENYLLTAFPIEESQKKKLKDLNLFCDVFYEDEYNFLFFKPKTFFKCLSYYRFFKKFDNIYLFLDHRIIGHFLSRFKIKYHLIEDEFDFFRFKSREEKIFDSNFKEKIYKFFMNPKGAGFSKCVIDIEVNNKKGLEKDSRYKKMIEVPRKTLFKNLTEKQKKNLSDIFDVKNISLDAQNKKCLVLTQPLWQDNFSPDIINSEKDQINFYKNIVEKYKSKYEIYFKVHPRDNADYNSINDVIFLDKNVPMEIYEFVLNFNFEIGITYATTGLDFLESVKEKIFIKDMEKSYE